MWWIRFSSCRSLKAWLVIALLSRYSEAVQGLLTKFSPGQHDCLYTGDIKECRSHYRLEVSIHAHRCFHSHSDPQTMPSDRAPGVRSETTLSCIALALEDQKPGRGRSLEFWWHPVKWIIHFDHNDIGGYSLLLSKQSQVPRVGTGTKQWSSPLWSLPFGLGVGLGVGGLTGFHHCVLYFTDIDTAQALGYLEHLSSSFVAQTVVTFTIR